MDNPHLEMTGIFQAGPEHKEALLHFLQKAPVENTFLLADIEQYGFTAPFQHCLLYTSRCV